MRMAMAAMVAGLALVGCSQNGDQEAGSDGVADPGLPSGNTRGPSSGLTSSGPSSASGGRTKVSGPAGLSADPAAAVNNCLTPEEQRRPASEFSAEERAAKIGCMNAAVAAQINPQLPKRIDEQTTLTHIDSTGPLLTYIYKVDVNASAVRPAMLEQLKTATRNAACANPQMRHTMSYGGSYGYRWSDRNGRSIGEMRIDGC